MNPSRVVAGFGLGRPLGYAGRTPTVQRGSVPLIVATYVAGGVTFQELGDEYGVSRERIRQIINEYDPRIIPAVKARRRADRRAEKELREQRRLERRQMFRRNQHGTPNCYNSGCRCPECREAHRIRSRLGKEARVERGRQNPVLIPHGTLSGYLNWDCRCESCREVHSAKCKAQWAARRKQAS